MSELAVIGAGAWGRAIARRAAQAGVAVTLWARRPESLGHMGDGVRLIGALPGGDAPRLIAVPMRYLRDVASALPPGGALVACCKGLDEETGALPLEILAVADHRLGVLTGPNFAAEIEAGLPAASVIASDNAGLRMEITRLLGRARWRIYGNDDPTGAQLGGAAKNVIAIAAGAVVGAGLGENARAALVTRGLAELGRLVLAMGGRAETVAGLSGLGDLLLTCTGARSRNFRAGVALGQGRSPGEALAGAGGVVEGAATAPALVRRAGAVELPICSAVALLLEGRLSIGEAMEMLLSRPGRDE